MSFIGPTLVNLEHVLSTDQAALGLAMSLDGAGYCVGAILCGVMFDKLESCYIPDTNQKITMITSIYSLKRICFG